MKKQLLYLVLLTLTHPASFAEKHPDAPAAQSQSHSRSGSPDEGFGLGVASFGGAGGATSITGWIPLKERSGVQVFLGIPTTSGDFNFSAGGAYKMTTHGTSMNGFHVGGNVLLGASAGNFTVQTGGLIGIHFAPAHSMLLAFDGGPQLNIVGGTADFSLDTFSTLLGASLIYFF